MRHISLNLCGPVWAAFFLSISAAAPAATPALSFETTFSALKEPAALHYKASYQDARGSHEVEVWRDGQNRLRRRTDARLDVYVTRLRDEDLHISVLDHSRRMRTDVSRSSLYQLGQFSDWFGLAHSLNKPHGAYVLQKLAAPGATEAALAPCQWYQLDAGAMHSRICWSVAYRLPLLIADAQGAVRWKVSVVDRDTAAAAVFEIADTGYIHVNADQDIKAD